MSCSSNPFIYPTVDDFKSRFDRDFPYAMPISGVECDETNMTKVRDKDIIIAMGRAKGMFPVNLIPDDDNKTEAYLLLSAHILVLNLKAGGQGVHSSWTWAINQKALGTVQESYRLPESMQKSGWLQMLTSTRYGALYYEMIAMLAFGNVRVNAGWTTP